jgi:hypothetical protein
MASLQTDHRDSSQLMNHDVQWWNNDTQCQNLIATSVPYNKKLSVRQCSSRFGCDYQRMKEKFEDTKGVIRSHNSKNRQYKGQQKKENGLQGIVSFL